MANYSLESGSRIYRGTSDNDSFAGELNALQFMLKQAMTKFGRQIMFMQKARKAMITFMPLIIQRFSAVKVMIHCLFPMQATFMLTTETAMTAFTPMAKME